MAGTLQCQPASRHAGKPYNVVRIYVPLYNLPPAYKHSMNHAPSTPKNLNRREWIWLAVTVSGLLLVYLSPLREHLAELHTFKEEITALGMRGKLFFIAGLCLLNSLGVPRLILFPLGGLAFGFAQGLVVCMSGAMIGAYIVFIFARFAGRGVVKKKWPAALRISNALEGRNFVTVALLRQVPSPGHLTNLFLGISPVSHSAFLLGTLFGALPSGILAVMIGSSATQTTDQGRFGMLAVAVGLLTLLWLGGGIYFKTSDRFKALRPQPQS